MVLPPLILRLLLSIGSAVLAILVFPPIGWSAFAVVAWVPLLFALRGAEPAHGFYFGLLHGGIFYGVTMAWLAKVFVGAQQMVVPLVLIMALFTAFFARGYAVAQRRYGPGWAAALFASCWWLALEFYRSEIFYLKFPWMTPGVGLGPTWISPLIGVSGASFLLILAAALVGQKKRHSLTGAVLMAVLLGSAVWQSTRDVPLGSDPVKITAVQSEVADIDNYIELSKLASGEQPADVILWPEYALPFELRKDVRASRKLFQFAETMGAYVVLGTHSAAPDEGWRNTAMTVDARGFVGEHYKNHTVHFFDDGVPGTESKAVATAHGKVGTPICFDCDYQDVIRRMTADGAEFFAIPSMDAIHWGEQEHYQHAELFRHRAAENGRWLAVAATSGVTQILDPNGKRVKSIPIIEEGALSGEIGRVTELTLYTRIGWLFPWVVMVAGALWMIVLFLQGLVERFTKGSPERSHRGSSPVDSVGPS